MDFLRGKKLIVKGKEVLADTVLKNKNLIVYYFTARNSQACKVFDSKLMEVYEEALLRKMEFVIVVVSGSVDKESYQYYLNDYKNWCCLQQNDELTHILIYNYGVTHVPALVVVNKHGTIITRDGVKDVEEIGINVLVTWSE